MRESQTWEEVTREAETTSGPVVLLFRHGAVGPTTRAHGRHEQNKTNRLNVKSSYLFVFLSVVPDRTCFEAGISSVL